MTIVQSKRITMSRILIQGALVLVALFGAITTAAAGQDAATKAVYHFTAQPMAVKAGAPATFTVQIMGPDMRPVTGAKVSATRVDMGPDGMAEMTGKIVPAGSADPSRYAFSTTLSMPGRWAVTIEAQIPGEAAPVRGQVILEAK
ncbi:FixH family protein [Emcibacter sp. SYSU 3D8]|uniref:FixH family protein n=1 Tax=Emcibacter sp. SYSU 3D8 TaxID=3133969 RepID=UPI0031FE7E2A